MRVWHMLPESGNVRSPLPDFGEKVWPDPAKMAGFRPKTFGSGRIRSYPAGSHPFWPDPARIFRIRPHQWQDPVISGLISARIRSDPDVLAKSSKSRPDSGHFGGNPTIFRPESGDQISAPAGYRQPDVVGLRRRLDSNDRQLLNSDNRISNVRVRTKSLISKNDLRF